MRSSEDLFTRPLWRQARAKVLARRGEHAEAERHAREALVISESTQDLYGQADAYATLPRCSALGDRPDEAATAFGHAAESATRGRATSSWPTARDKTRRAHGRGPSS